jgi:hypothetical protein
MTEFDSILRDMGLTPIVRDSITTAWVDTNGFTIAKTGLIERGHPPTLVWPRPLRTELQWIDEKGETWTVSLPTNGCDIDRMVKEVGAKEVLRIALAGETWKNKPDLQVNTSL